MLNFRKVSAASDGAAVAGYMTEERPEPTTLAVHGVSIDGRDLETGGRLTARHAPPGRRNRDRDTAHQPTAFLAAQPHQPSAAGHHRAAAGFTPVS